MTAAWGSPWTPPATPTSRVTPHPPTSRRRWGPSSRPSAATTTPSSPRSIPPAPLPSSIPPTSEGGSGSFDGGFGIAVDTAGNAYVVGYTQVNPSANFPTTAGAFQPTFGGGVADAFVTKLNPTGSAPLV